SLLIGCARALTSASALYDCVVNCTTNIRAPAHILVDNYIQLLWLDTDRQDILPNLHLVLAQIHKWRTVEHKRVLVHCELGISRSATCVIAYLLKYYPTTYPTVTSALDTLVSVRAIVKPNRGFLAQLTILHATNFKEVEETKKELLVLEED